MVSINCLHCFVNKSWIVRSLVSSVNRCCKHSQESCTHYVLIFFINWLLSQIQVLVVTWTDVNSKPLKCISRIEINIAVPGPVQILTSLVQSVIFQNWLNIRRTCGHSFCEPSRFNFSFLNVQCIAELRTIFFWYSKNEVSWLSILIDWESI